MAFKAIIFDLDGTLLDTLEDLGNSVNRVLAGHGFPVHRIDAYRYFVGDGFAKLIMRALPENERSQELVDICLDEFKDDYGRNWNRQTGLYDGISAMLDTLTGRGLKMAVLSNKKHEFTLKCVKTLLPHWKFEAVFGQREHLPPKPDPAGALEIAQMLKLSPSDFLYMGDSAVDIKTAQAAGMHPVGVTWGFRPAEELIKNGCRSLINRPQDVITLLS